MPKYLLEANYTAEGLRGVLKDSAGGRREAVSKMLTAAGCKLDVMYYALGDRDVYLVCDCPDNATAAALSIAASASGLVRTKTTPLFTVEETDQLLRKGVTYRAPGS
jgi:uncharacterized protein with GYD domain